MKWLYSIRHKFRFALLLAFVITLVVWNNIQEKNRLEILGQSFSSVYEDRLLVESYIYRLSEHIHHKQLLTGRIIRNSEQVAPGAFEAHHTPVRELLRNYEKTRLTEQEEALFSSFKSRMEALFLLEAEYAHTGNRQLYAAMELELAEASMLLDKLSDIQVTEGKNLAETSRRMVMSGASSSRFEMALVIVIALIILALLAFSGSALPRFDQQARLN